MMMNEQIIELLSEIRSGYNCFDEADRRFYEALSVAIKALSNTPNTFNTLEALEAERGEGMMFFKDRKELADKAEQWMEENHVAKTPLSVISYLEANGICIVRTAEAITEVEHD